MGHCVPNGRVNVRKYTGAMAIGCRALRKLPALRWEKKNALNINFYKPHFKSVCNIACKCSPAGKSYYYYDARHIMLGR